MAISSHETPIEGESDEWLTPPDIIADLGPFDLDPCCPVIMPWRTATIMRSKEDVLFEHWPDDAFVWLNPPYSDIARWMNELSIHPGGGIALVFARTETAWFVSTVWKRAMAIAFLHGRVTFHLPDGRPGPGNAGAPSCLVAYGTRGWNRLQRLRRPHTLVHLKGN